MTRNPIEDADLIIYAEAIWALMIACFFFLIVVFTKEPKFLKSLKNELKSDTDGKRENKNLSL